MTDNIRRLWQAINRAGDGKYQPAQATAVLAVGSVERDSTGAIVAATGTLDGSGEFTVPLKGHSAAPGDHLLVGYPANRPVGAELAYLRHVASDYAGAGLVIVDANLPAPTGLGITSALVVTPGSITASATIAWVAVPDKYQPSGYLVSYRIDGGDWDDRGVSHLGGTQQVEVKGLPPGATIDAHARARYNYANADSPPTADVSATLAADTGSPGGVTALAVSVATPGQLSITPTATIDVALFRGYQYELNDAATGSPDSTSAPIPGPWDAVLPPGTYYVAARPVSKSGTLGTRFPATGFQGPYTVLDQSANLDTVPPAAMGAPTLATQLVQFADNTWHGYLTVTRPAYTPPSDLAQYEISVVVDDGRNWIAVEPVQPGVTSWTYEAGFGGFTVALRGRDQAGNAPVFGATATATIAPPALSNTAPTVATTTVGAGIKVAWDRIAGALAYEVQRANDAGGGGAATVATVASRWYFDPLSSDTVILPTYYYRVRPTSVANGAVIVGTYSGWVAGTAGAVDAQNLRVASIVSALIGADQILANHIAAGAIETGALAADVIIASLLRTATTGTRWEVRGAGVAAPANVIRFIESLAAVDYERVRLQGTGLTVYGDAAQSDITLGRNASGRGQLVAHGVTIGHDGTVPFLNVDLSASARFQLTGPDSVGYIEQGSYRGITSLWLRSTTGALGDPLLTLYHNVGGGSGFEKLGLAWNGLRATSASFANETTWLASQGRWTASGQVLAPILAGNDLAHYETTTTPIQAKYTAANLGLTGGSRLPLQAWAFTASNSVSARLQAYRGATIGAQGWSDARFILEADVDNYGAHLGGVQFGAKGFWGVMGFTLGGTLYLYWDATSNRWDTNGQDFRVGGTLTKVAGSFVIPHPQPGKEGWELRHCFFESADRGGTLVRLAVEIAAAGSAATATTSNHDDLPATVEAVEGGYRVRVALYDWWRYLNEFGQVMVNPVGQFAGGYGEIVEDGAALLLTVERRGRYAVWVSGTRTDPAAHDWWDRRGLEKTTGQQWTNDHTADRRASLLGQRAARDARAGRVVAPLAPLGQRGLYGTPAHTR